MDTEQRRTLASQAARALPCIWGLGLRIQGRENHRR